MCLSFLHPRTLSGGRTQAKCYCYTSTAKSYPASGGNSAKANIPAMWTQWRPDVHSNPRSCIRLHPAPPLPLPQSPLQALSSTMPPWEPEYSENAELFL